MNQLVKWCCVCALMFGTHWLAFDHGEANGDRAADARWIAAILRTADYKPGDSVIMKSERPAKPRTVRSVRVVMYRLHYCFLDRDHGGLWSVDESEILGRAGDPVHHVPLNAREQPWRISDDEAQALVSRLANKCFAHKCYEGCFVDPVPQELAKLKSDNPRHVERAMLNEAFSPNPPHNLTLPIARQTTDERQPLVYKGRWVVFQRRYFTNQTGTMGFVWALVDANGEDEASIWKKYQTGTYQLRRLGTDLLAKGPMIESDYMFLQRFWAHEKNR